jgi:regulatory protein
LVDGRGARGKAKTPKSCHERALGLLAVRARSRRELERRLLQAGFEEVEVEDVLGRLERVGLVDDQAFAKQVADHAFGVKRSGRRAVVGSLMAAGVAPDIIQATVSEAGDEEERADALAHSRASRLGSVDPVRAYSRLTSLLVRRGYSPEVARQAARRALAVNGAGSDQGDANLASGFTRP